jgi:hypothetical protein
MKFIAVSLIFGLVLAAADDKAAKPAAGDEKTAKQSGESAKSASAPAKPAASQAAPAVPSNEQLSYAINWPTGLSLGEASLSTSRRKTDDGERIETQFKLDAAVPGFAVLDQFRSVSDGNLCSLEFEKKYSHGKRKTEEKTTFDQQKNTAVRETTGGGKTDLTTTACAKDALAFVQFVRRELSQGRVPPHQNVYFGATYRVSLQFTGTQNITVSERRWTPIGWP